MAEPAGGPAPTGGSAGDSITSNSSGGGGLLGYLNSMLPFFGAGRVAAAPAATSSLLSEATLAAERAILSLVGVPVVARDVPVGPTERHTMRTYEVGATATPPTPANVDADDSSAAPPPVVLLPGYGAGAGLFFRNMSPLARLGLPILAADWVGTGLSGRPPFPLKATKPDGSTTRVAAERFFLDGLDAWLEAEGVSARRPAVLVGHSLGGYLAATYALERPEMVRHLVLVSPAGLPEQPAGWREGLHKRVAESSGRLSLRPYVVRWAERAWDAGTTHGGILRGLGAWAGGRLMRRYASGRFGAAGGEALAPREAEVVGDYLFALTALEGSGEHALRHLLDFGAWAHAPLGKRLEALSARVPVSFVYGRQDWMKFEHAVAVGARLDAVRAPTAEQDHRVIVLESAGHFPFLEAPAAFDAALESVLRQYCNKVPAAAAAAAGGGGGKGVAAGARAG
jgi:pimeloyl-ACP methyl ester carboxylesterase